MGKWTTERLRITEMKQQDSLGHLVHDQQLRLIPIDTWSLPVSIWI